MTDVHEVWKSLQALSGDDREWLFTQLLNWPSFQSFLRSRHQGGAANVERITIVFDGGSRGNPGPGYGSYALQFDDRTRETIRVEFDRDMTNNEAEYEILIRALEDLRGRLEAMGADPHQHEVMVLGDSRLVVNQVTGTWKARDPRMLRYRDRVRQLVQGFHHVSLEKIEREEIEKIVGH